jgi:hypothetical protein
MGTAIVLLLNGCSSVTTAPSIEASRGLTTSGAQLVAGTKAPVTRFASDDIVYFYAELNWSDIAFSKGSRNIEWRWRKGDDVIVKTSSRYILESSKSLSFVRPLQEPS